MGCFIYEHAYMWQEMIIKDIRKELSDRVTFQRSFFKSLCTSA